jgi:hypothetical protein
VNFPLLFGTLLSLFAAGTLVYLLVVSVARQHREAGLLKALGFARRQVAFTVTWQTTTIALAGIVIGVPAGATIGRLVWQAFAVNLGALAVPVVNGGVLAAVTLATVIVANALAAGPALAAHDHARHACSEPNEAQPPMPARQRSRGGHLTILPPGLPPSGTGPRAGRPFTSEAKEPVREAMAEIFPSGWN